MITVNSRQAFLFELERLLPKESSGVELGVLYGEFSKLILDIINPKSLVLVDPYKINSETYNENPDSLTTAYSTEDQYQDLIKKFYDEIMQGRIVVIRKYSFDLVRFLSDNLYDFIYIDASHVYSDVKRDLNDWLPKLKSDGLMCLHDYIECPDFGVIKAVDEFIEEHNFEMIVHNQNGGDIVLKRK